MRQKIAVITGLLLVLVSVGLLVVMLQDATFAVLDPKGIIAEKQRELMVIATLLMLLIVIPVFILTFTIAWKYRAGNSKAQYSPEWDHNKKFEAIWWGFPLLIIVVLSVIIYKSSHDLDPYKPINSPLAPVTIQVVALEWKWLFIYPDHDIATVNYLRVPTNRPINFEITSDAPMNSFWIPQLGGQMYAMAGMKTKLHLMANEEGEYNGSSANLSGEGFAGMRFVAEATTEQDFKAWISNMRTGDTKLSIENYSKLAKQSSNNPRSYYADTDEKLYDTIIMKYLHPLNDADEEHQISTGHHH